MVRNGPALHLKTTLAGRMPLLLRGRSAALSLHRKRVPDCSGAPRRHQKCGSYFREWSVLNDLRSSRPTQLILLALAMTALSGCRTGFYSSQGSFASHGGKLGTWQMRPQGCSLAPFDGLPLAQSTSVAELVWQHGRSVHKTAEGVNDRWEQGPSILDVSRTPAGVTARFTFVQTKEPVVLDASDCAVLRIETHPGPPAIPGGPPSADGVFQMDCTTHRSHLTADLHFRGCAL